MAPHNCIKVKRDGPRGWHWIAADAYDADRHVLVDSEAAPVPVEPQSGSQNRGRRRR